MPTLAELMQKFGGEASRGASDPNPTAPPAGGQVKTAGDKMTLQEIYLSLDRMDKTAAPGEAAAEPTDADFAAMAEKVAAAEAEALAGEGGGAEDEAIKIAAEYDAAGRIMCRGFFDEWLKLALDTSTPPNQTTESDSAARTPALGERSLPTVETNFAGSPNHDQPIVTRGAKQVYQNVLESQKKVDAGVTGDNPEAAAVSLGSGAPTGFATVRDLMGGRVA